MREYELLYILNGELAEDAANKATDTVNAAVLQLGGKVTSEDPWGRKRLAYEINKQDHGWYVVARLQLNPAKATELNRALRLNEHVLRSILLLATELPGDAEKEVIERALSASAPTKPATRPKRSTPTPVAAPAAEEAAIAEKKSAKKETSAEKKKRQATLDEKLGQILSEE